MKPACPSGSPKAVPSRRKAQPWPGLRRAFATTGGRLWAARAGMAVSFTGSSGPGPDRARDAVDLGLRQPRGRHVPRLPQAQEVAVLRLRVLRVVVQLEQ